MKNLNWGANNSSMPVVFLSSNLDLQSRIYNQIFINSGSQNAAELTAVVKDGAGNVLQTVTELKRFTDQWYAIPITEILPSEVHTIYTIQVFAGDEAVSEVAEYSVESCLYDLYYLDSMADYRDLGVAIMRYCVAADNAF